MTSQQGQLQALITEIEALLGRATPRLPWMKPGEAGEQRRVMEQALAYLKEVEETATTSPGWGIVANARALTPIDVPASEPAEPPDPTEATSQQVLQALLQEMQYLRAQMVQPLTSEVMALQQQRETLKNEVRQLEQERLQRAMTAAESPNPVWVNEVVEQLRSSLMAQLTPQLQALQSQASDYPALYGAVSAESVEGVTDLPQLSPQQRLEQLRQIQAQTDAMLLRLDANLRTVFESLDQSIQSYCDTLNHGLDAMHGLGQQGEFLFRTFINHLAEQLQDESADFSTRLTRRQETARLRGSDPDWSTAEGEDATDRDELMAAIADFDEVDLDDLDDVDLDAEFEVDEEVTLFQLDEEFGDWPLDAEADEDWEAIAAADDAEDDPGEPTIMQTEPMSWEQATGQVAEASDDSVAIDEEPTVAYTEEIDALYASIFGNAEASPEAAATKDDTEDETVDQSLRNLDAAPVVAEPPAAEAAIAAPLEADSPSLDLDFLLEADAPASPPAAPPPEPSSAADTPLTNLMGAEMAAELSPPPLAGGEVNDRITSLVELLPESDQRLGARPVDPFVTFDESEDAFIPAPPDENLLDIEVESAPPQVELDLDEAILNQLTADLSQLESLESAAPAPTAPPSPPAAEPIAADLTTDLPAAESPTPPPLSEPAPEPPSPASGPPEPSAEPSAPDGLPSMEPDIELPPAEPAPEPPTAPTDNIPDEAELPSEFTDLFVAAPDRATEPVSESLADPPAPDESDLDAASAPDAIAAPDSALDVSELFPEATAMPAIADLVDEALTPPDETTAPPTTDPEDAVLDDFADWFDEPTATADESDDDWQFDEPSAEMPAAEPPEAMTSEASDEDIDLTLSLLSEDDDFEAETSLATDLKLTDSAPSPEAASDRPTPAASQARPPVDRIEPPVDEATAVNDIADFFGEDPLTPAIDDPSTAEDLSLDTFFDEAEAAAPDLTAELPSAEVAETPESVEDITLETAFDPEATAPETAPEAASVEDLTLGDIFASDAAPDSPTASDFPEALDAELMLDETLEADDDFEMAAPDAATDDLTFENAFGAEEEVARESESAPLTDDLTLENAFGAEEEAAHEPESAAPIDDLTFENAFGAEDEAAREPESAAPLTDDLTLENAFGAEDEVAREPEPTALTDDLTFENAFGAEDEDLTFETAFAEEPAATSPPPADRPSPGASPTPPSSATDDEPLNLETLEAWSAAETVDPEQSEAAANLTAEGLFDAAATPDEAASDEGDWSLTLEDISLDLELPDLPDDPFSLSPEADRRDRQPEDDGPGLTLEAGLFDDADAADNADDSPLTVEDETVTPDDLVEQLDAADLPADIPPVADELSLENWVASLDAAAPPDSPLDALTFEDLDLNLSLDVESLEADPADSEPSTAADLFSELEEEGGWPPQDEVDVKAASPSPDPAATPPPPPAAPPISPPAESPATSGEAAPPPPDRPSAAESEAGNESPPRSAFALTQTADAGVQLTSAAPSEALARSLAAIPDATASDVPAVATPPETAPPGLTPALPSPDWTVSGSATEGYRLEINSLAGAENIDRALSTAPAAREATPATPSPTEAAQLQQQVGRRVISLTDLVLPTSLPFAATVDLPLVPAATDPIAGAGSQPRERAIGLDRALPDVPGLPLRGSVEDGFAVSFEPSAQPTIGVPLTDAASENAPLTDAELAALFPPETVPPADQTEPAEPAEPTEPTESADDLLAEPIDQAVADLFPPTADAPSAASDEAPATDAPPAAPPTEPTTDPDPATPTAADPFDWDPMDTDFPSSDAADTAFDRDLDQELEAVPPLADLDLSMEEISESEIASDEAFRSAFEDLIPDLEPSANEAASPDEAIAPPSARPPSADPGPVVTPAASADPAAPETAATVFASSGMLATLGDDEADPDAPDADAAPDADLAAEWFLGIDFGTSGLSAVLMEHYSGSAHPLCWVADAATGDQPAHFRLPAIAAVQSAAASATGTAAIVAVGPSAASQSATTADPSLLHTLRPLLRVGIPHVGPEGGAEPVLQWSATQTVPLQQVMAAVQALLQLISQPEAAALQLEAIGLETPDLEAVLGQLQGVVMGIPTNWSDTYCFNLREAVLATGLVDRPDQIFFVEEAIAAILSGLPDPNEPPLDQNRQVQTLYQCNWQGGTVVISGGAACTEVGMVDLPHPLDALSREDLKLRNLAYGGDALDLDIICQLLVPSERRQPLEPGDRRAVNQGWGWQAALPEVANARWADLQIEALDLPQLAEPDPSTRQRLRQQLRASPLGQSLLEAARYLKLILQNQNQYQLELADQSWRVLRRDLESRVLVPYIQRINQQVNALLSQTGLASQGINQVICTGGNASFNTIAKWLRQKFPNATIIQDTYPSDRPQTCSRVAYGLVNLCRYPQVLDGPRHQYGDYFLLHEMLRVIPDAPLPFDGILHLLEAAGINTEVCQLRIAAILEGHLPPGLLPDAATRELLSRDTLMSQTYQNLAAGSLFSKQTRNIYMVNAAQRDRLRHHLETLMQDQQQSLTEPLIAQLVSV